MPHLLLVNPLLVAPRPARPRYPSFPLCSSSNDILVGQADGDIEGENKPQTGQRKRTPFFGAFFKQLLDPNVAVSDRVTEFFAAALGKAISKMYESMGKRCCLLFVSVSVFSIVVVRFDAVVADSGGVGVWWRWREW